MKSNKLFFGALTLLAFTACSDDKNNEPISGEDTFAYINVNLLSPGLDGGRGVEDLDNDDFQEGTPDENNITSLVMVFYDALGQQMASASTAGGEITLKDATPDKNMPNVAKIKTANAKVTLSNGKIPSYMMVFANPINASDVEWNLGSIAQKTRTEYKSANGFAMNNSVHFHADKTLQRAVKVSEENFFQDPATSATAVDVYLERLAAKVKLHGKTGTESTLGTQSGSLENEDKTTATLSFEVKGWGINGAAKSCYLSKYFNLSNYSNSYDQLNEQLKDGFADWNDAGRHRSYWAITPHYYKPANNNNGSKFPYVSDQVVNSGTNASTLYYYSWKDFESGANTHVEVNNSCYTLENTVQSSFYNNCDYRNSALVSAIVVGQYKYNNEIRDFYIYGKNIFLKEDLMKYLAKTFPIIVKKDGKALTQEDNISALFDIYHPGKALINESKGVEENKVTIKLKGTKGYGEKESDTNDFSAFTEYRYQNGSTLEEISASNIDNINKLLYQTCNTANMYKEGKAYFNIPIRHLAEGDGEGKNSEGNYVAGAYGVVRNHLYDITINGFATLSFETLGKGVRDPEDPIVPPTDPGDKYGIDANIKVHSWRLVTQTVTLGEK